MSPFALFFISILFLVTIGMRLLKIRVIYPSFIVLFSWSCIFGALFWGNLGMYTLSDKLLFFFSLWLSFFFIGCSVTRFIRINSCNSPSSYDANLFDLLYRCSILITPILIYRILNVLLLGGNFLALRMATVGLEDEIDGIGALKYFNPIVLVLFLAELYKIRPNESRKKLYVLLFINVLFIISTMAKVGVFFLVIPAIVVISFKKKIRFRKLLLVGGLLFGLFVLIQLGRGGGADSSIFDAILNMLKIYLFAGVPAMDQVIEERVYSGLCGELVFSSFYKLLNVFGGDFLFGTGNSFVGSGDGYALVPLPTNVFTVLYAFYVDFGVTGIMFFAFLTGLYAGIIYRLAQKNRTWAIILYSHIAASLSLQFFSDFIFLMLSQTLQLLFWTYMLYHFHLKYHFVFYKKRVGTLYAK